MASRPVRKFTHKTCVCPLRGHRCQNGGCATSVLHPEHGLPGGLAKIRVPGGVYVGEYGCHVDPQTGGPDACVEDCYFARLVGQYEACEYWRKIDA